MCPPPKGRVVDEALWQLADMTSGAEAERHYEALVDGHPRSGRALPAASRVLRSLVKRGRVQQAEALAHPWQDHKVRDLAEVHLVDRMLVAKRRGDRVGVTKLAALHSARFVDGRYGATPRPSNASRVDCAETFSERHAP